MKILINCLSLQSGGGVAYIKNILPNIALEASSRGDSLFLLCYQYQYESYFTELDEALDDVEGFSYILVNKNRHGYIARLIWEYRNIAKIAKIKEIDAIFNPYQIGVPVRGVKTILLLSNMEPFVFRKYSYPVKLYVRNYLLRIATKIFLSRADRVIGISKFVQKCLRDDIGLDDSAVTTIYLGRDTDFCRDSSVDYVEEVAEFDIHNQFIFTCGSLLPYRRAELVIEAFVSSKIFLETETKLVIAGSSDDDRYRSLLQSKIKEHRAENRVLMLGFVDKQAMISLYGACDLFVMASEVEACPNIALESMSMGCKIVASESNPLPEIFGNAAYFFEAGNVAALRNSIDNVINDDNFEKSSIAVRRVEKFCWRDSARETYEYITSAVNT